MNLWGTTTCTCVFRLLFSHYARARWWAGSALESKIETLATRVPSDMPPRTPTPPLASSLVPSLVPILGLILRLSLSCPWQAELAGPGMCASLVAWAPFSALARPPPGLNHSYQTQRTKSRDPWVQKQHGVGARGCPRVNAVASL